MKATFKTFTIAAACTLPITGYAGHAMTLEELNAFLEALRTEGLKNLEPFREKIEKARGVFPAKIRRYFEDFGGSWYKELPEDREWEKKQKKELKETFLKEHKAIPGEPNTWLGLDSDEADEARNSVFEALQTIEFHGGVGKCPSTVTKIEYNPAGEPISIEAIHNTSFLIERRLDELGSPFHSYIIGKRDPKKTDERFAELSEELTEDALKRRKIDVVKLQELGIKNVREITFASILKNRIFTDKQRIKADEWLKDLSKLEKAIEEYAEAYPWVQKNINCKFKNRNIASEKALNWEQKTIQFADKVTEFPFTLSYLVLKPTDTISEEQKKIETFLKNLLPYKNGKEKVILLLLLDETMPPACCLKWIHEEGEFSDGSYDPRDNAFRFSFKREMKFLSHEIGHYLQTHLGLYQTFEDYQTKFARRLLQLENKQTEDSIAIPDSIKDDIELGNQPAFWGLKDFCLKCPKQLSTRKFFEYFQLSERWHSTVEIGNILGVYFRGDTLYLDALSDIRELKRIRFTHAYRANKENMERAKGYFEEEKDKTLFEGIAKEAYGKSVPTEMLHLLCRLHQRKDPDADAQNVVCDFDLSNGRKEWDEKVKPLISDFIEAEP